MSNKINIAIAEDQGLVRQGFIRMLKDYENINILLDVSNGQELLEGLKTCRPDIILLDISMPILSGIPTLKKMKQRFPMIKVIIISGYSNETSIIEYAKLGANSFLDKNCNVEVLVSVISAVYENGNYFNSTITKKLNELGIFQKVYTGERELTTREINIIKLIYLGKKASEIAALMGFSESNFPGYKVRMLQKTNCGNLEDLISYAKKNHLI